MEQDTSPQAPSSPWCIASHPLTKDLLEQGLDPIPQVGDFTFVLHYIVGMFSLEIKGHLLIFSTIKLLLIPSSTALQPLASSFVTHFHEDNYVAILPQTGLQELGSVDHHAHPTLGNRRGDGPANRRHDRRMQLLFKKPQLRRIGENQVRHYSPIHAAVLSQNPRPPALHQAPTNPRLIQEALGKGVCVNHIAAEPGKKTGHRRLS